ncbi:FAD/NAD(P)-binding domain-containing protein [Panus rudis PR-1116 ss-1]|nr:FAD/NAD(P)-binding domain-containing protein [Panus rudis PR-1116 ss-1]
MRQLRSALSKAGYKVAHLDSNPYYGGDHASLTVDELIEWANAKKQGTLASAYRSAQRRKFSSITIKHSPIPKPRSFSISLTPTIIPSVGPLVDALVASGVSRYGGFKLLDKVAVYEGPSRLQTVPTSKEDVFTSKDLSLIDRRRLMRFLTFAGGEYEQSPELGGHENDAFFSFLRDIFRLPDKVATAITYALAFCTSGSEPTIHALRRVHRYLHSSGRYGPSPFLVGHYGGLGEIAQGFCRAAAVHGATYVLGHAVTVAAPIRTEVPQPAVRRDSDYTRWSLTLQDISETFDCQVVVSDTDYLPTTTAPNDSRIARCIAILNKPISFSKNKADKADTHEEAPIGNIVDTALIVFPPSSVEGGSATTAVQALVSGEGSMSTPPGHWILHLTLPGLNESGVEAEVILQPYLQAVLALAGSEPADPLLTLYYLETSPGDSLAVVADSLDSPEMKISDRSCLAETADSAALKGEETFWATLKELKARGHRPSGESGRLEDVEHLWPPLEDTGEDDSTE